jgi:hypothetical protein
MPKTQKKPRVGVNLEAFLAAYDIKPSASMPFDAKGVEQDVDLVQEENPSEDEYDHWEKIIQQRWSRKRIRESHTSRRYARIHYRAHYCPNSRQTLVACGTKLPDPLKSSSGSDLINSDDLDDKDWRNRQGISTPYGTFLKGGTLPVPQNSQTSQTSQTSTTPTPCNRGRVYSEPTNLQRATGRWKKVLVRRAKNKQSAKARKSLMKKPHSQRKNVSAAAGLPAIPSFSSSPASSNANDDWDKPHVSGQASPVQTSGVRDIGSWRNSFFRRWKEDLLWQIPNIKAIRDAPLPASVVHRFLHQMHKSRRPVLGFHGTSLSNMQSICNEGLLVPGVDGIRVANGNVFGQGIYTSTNPTISTSYMRGTCTMFACAVLEGTGTTRHGNLLVSPNKSLVLPLFLVDIAQHVAPVRHPLNFQRRGCFAGTCDCKACLRAARVILKKRYLTGRRDGSFHMLPAADCMLPAADPPSSALDAVSIPS